MNTTDRVIWWVGEDQPRPGGGTLRAACLSPAFKSQREAERALESLRPEHPGAYVFKLTEVGPEPGAELQAVQS